MRRNFFAAICDQWARHDPPAAFEWAQHLPDAATRDYVMPSIVWTVAQNDPAIAAQMLPRLTGDAQIQAAVSIMLQWAKSDPEAASVWAASLPEGEWRGLVFEELINHWAQSDPATAAFWLGGLPQGPSRDQAVSAFASHIISSDPQGALQWASTISNDSRREYEVELTARAWLKMDPHKAATWISNASLPDDTKARLLNPGG